MPTQVQFRRGTAVQNDSFTGAEGEISVDTTNDVIRVHDGATAGGFAMVGVSATQTLTNKTLSAPTVANATLSGTTSGTTTVNITGTITGSGNVTGGNLITAGLAEVTGNVTGGNLVTAGQVVATGNVTGGNLKTSSIVVSGTTITGATTVSATNLTGTLTTAAQPNITSVGTLSSLTVTANVTGGNLVTAGQASIGGNATVGGTLTVTGNLDVNGTITTIDSTTVTIADLMINVANNAATAAAANGGGIGVGPAGSEYAKLTYASSGDKWVSDSPLDVTGALTATGNISGGNVSATLGAFTTVTGNGRGLTSITADNIDAGTLASARLSGSYSISVTGTAATVTTAAQPNITSVGTLSSLTVTGNVTGGNLITAGLVSLASITKTGSNGVGNIGSSTSVFNTVFAKATSAQYADLAENYEADAAYEPGTVMKFGGANEVTICLVEADNRVAGVVSHEPAFLMNSHTDGVNTTAIALMGRVPCRVTGPIAKGDMLVSDGRGGAMACATPAIGTVIGKALENFDGAEGTIEVVVGRV